jgi:hypothetical protein
MFFYKKVIDFGSISAILSGNENRCNSIHFDSARIHKIICITLEAILTWFTMAKGFLRRRSYIIYNTKSRIPLREEFCLFIFRGCFSE